MIRNVFRKNKRLISAVLVVTMVLACFAAGTLDTNAAEKKVKYIAHRGLSAKAPENTLAAFRLASAQKGFYGVEFDIWESTAEKKTPLLIVMHDDNTKRMCDRNTKVRSLTRAKLKKYTIKHGSNVKKYSGQKIPTADQALETIWKNSKGAIPVIELKHRLSTKGLKYLFDLIGDHEAVIISFDFNAVSDAAKLAKTNKATNIRTMYLMKKLPKSKYSSTISRMKKAGINGISLKYTAITKTIVTKFHKAGMEVSAWTLPDKKTAKKYINMGVDYITANGVLF